MKLYLSQGLVLATLASTRAVHYSEPSYDNVNHDQDLGTRDLTHDSSRWIERGTGDDGGSAWHKAVQSGRALYLAMQSKDSIAWWFFRKHPDFAGTCQSQFDGDLREKLEEWGYKDDEELSQGIQKECDFDEYHKIKKAFDELGLGTQANANGGPNQCFRIDHQSGPKVKLNENNQLPDPPDQHYEVDGQDYRITGSTHEFAVSPAGALVLMNVISAAHSAERYWGRKPQPEELPKIRSTSDIAWGVWNRVVPENLKEIKYLMVTQIMNTVTCDLIRSAYTTLATPQSETKVWPGTEFSMDTEGGQALLGSPVGRWAGYFLVQHKAQLGSNRFIIKVRVFKPETGTLPVMLFYVDPNPASDDLAARDFAPGFTL